MTESGASEEDPRAGKYLTVPIRTLRRWHSMISGWDAVKIRKLMSELRYAAEREPLLTGHFEVFGDMFVDHLSDCTCSMISMGVSTHEPYCGIEPIFGVDDVVEPLRRAGWTCTPPDEGGGG